MALGHAVDGGQAVVVGEVQHDDVQDQGGVGGLDLVLGAPLDGDAVLPVSSSWSSSPMVLSSSPSVCLVALVEYRRR